MSAAPLPQPAGSRPARRALLGGALGAAGLALAGCRVRWEDSAPEIPFNPIPTREPIPAEAALVWLLTDSRDLAGSSAAGADRAAQALYEEQVAVLRTALYRAGVPIETLDEALAVPATPTPAPAPAPAPMPAPAPTADPSAALRRVGELIECGGGVFPLVLSLLAQRWAAVLASGDAIPAAALAPQTAPAWSLPYLAVPFWTLTDAAVYGFEVAAAQSQDLQRASALTSLARIQDLLQNQDERSGGTVPAPSVGHPLPFPVDSPESAAALAEEVSRGLVGGYAGLLPTLVGTAQQESARDVLAWLGTATSVAGGWGVPVAAFPGSSPAEPAAP